MKPYHRILCAHDSSEPAAYALDAAVSLARETSALLDVLYADAPHRGPFGLQGPSEASPVSQRARDAGAPLEGVLLPRGRVQVHHASTGGVPTAEAIASYAVQYRADLVVMGTHGGRGLRRRLRGSVAEDVVHRVACPVLLLRAGELLRYDGPVVVAVSFTDGCDEAIVAGLHLAYALRASLRYIHVIPSSRITTRNEEAVRARLQRRVGGASPAPGGSPSSLRPLHLALLYGSPADEIAAYANDVGARALVVGLPRGVRPLFGGTTEHLFHRAPCPLLVAKARPAPPHRAPTMQEAASL